MDEKWLEIDKNTLQETLLDEYRAGKLVIDDVWQQRPNTAVKITVLYKDRYVSAYSFSKPSWPDIWNPAYGIDLAIKKAIAYLSRELSK